jgi:hypothetical protein
LTPRYEPQLDRRFHAPAILRDDPAVQRNSTPAFHRSYERTLRIGESFHPKRRRLIDWAATLFFLANWSPHQSLLIPLRKLGRTRQATASTRRGELGQTQAARLLGTLIKACNNFCWIFISPQFSRLCYEHNDRRFTANIPAWSPRGIRLFSCLELRSARQSENEVMLRILEERRFLRQ